MTFDNIVSPVSRARAPSSLKAGGTCLLSGRTVWAGAAPRLTLRPTTHSLAGLSLSSEEPHVKRTEGRQVSDEEESCGLRGFALTVRGWTPVPSVPATQSVLQGREEQPPTHL